MAGTTCEGVDVATVPSQPLWWRARHVRALIRPLFTRTAWAQTAPVEAGTKVEGVALVSVRWFGLGLATHCDSVHDR